jgi:hypothetical protein
VKLDAHDDSTKRQELEEKGETPGIGWLAAAKNAAAGSGAEPTSTEDEEEPNAALDHHGDHG